MEVMDGSPFKVRKAAVERAAVDRAGVSGLFQTALGGNRRKISAPRGRYHKQIRKPPQLVRETQICAVCDLLLKGKVSTLWARVLI